MIEDREIPDGTLVERVCATGDEEAFRALYRRHSPRLYALLLRLLGGRQADAEDVLQEVWIRAVQRMDRTLGTSEILPWLRAIALNVLRESARRYRRRLRLVEENGEPPADRVEAASPLRLDLDRAISRLPQRCRRVLVLHDLEGYTHEQIGVLLGIAAGTSKSQLSLARTRLRQAMSTGESEGEQHVEG